MKNTLLLSLFLIAVFAGNAQVSSLHENFDATCVSASLPTSHEWRVFDPMNWSTSATPGNWTCSPANGRGGTPGVQCSGYYSGVFNLDTSYLITPLLYFHGAVTGQYFLNFDTKADSITLGGELIVSVTDSPGIHSPFDVVVSDTIHRFSIADSAGWVTHQIDISQFEDTLRPFYIAFRYSSNTSAGSLWFLDNVNTTSVSLTLDAADLKKDMLPITIVGNSTPNKVSFTCSSEVAGPYYLSVFDMQGREVYKSILNINSGKGSYAINDLNLQDGMYLVKIDNGIRYGTAKTLIR